MASGPAKEWDALEDFERRTLTLAEKTKTVLVAGEGAPVIVMSEIPGITPEVARFARWVRDAGFRIWMPSLFGEPGRPVSRGYALQSVARVCISREFYLLGSERTSPVVEWLRALAAHASQESGGKGVGAIGMCLTGNFALAMMLEPAMKAPVLSQPSLPSSNPAGMHISQRDVAAVRERLEREDLSVLAYRFAGDPLCTAARFAAFEAALGDRFEGRVLPDSASNPKGPVQNHSVVTLNLIDEAGQPTRQAVDDIIAFFKWRLA
ncbi:MAG: dienelactone hydrolase family protein [Hyphomonadaceae bacterium]|nr:dienelactone hydrolase family protein [Hyphomonadaceae bacterium]